MGGQPATGTLRHAGRSWPALKESMRAGIALGSNLGNLHANLSCAIGHLRRLAIAEPPFLISSFYRTAPVDCPPGSGDFLNAVAEFTYSGGARDLLGDLREIESLMGRPPVRDTNAPRPIDLDILYCDDQVLSDTDLILPHPRMHLRLFVLEPLCEIAPQRVIPIHGKTAFELKDRININNL